MAELTLCQLVTENNKINCYEKWEEAFRMYAGIFSKAHPHRAIEIWQHVENIKDAADENTWESCLQI